MNLKHKIWIIFVIGFVAYFLIFLILIIFLFGSLDFGACLVISPIASVFTSRIYYESQLRKLKLDDPQFNEAIKSLINEKSEISMSDLFNLFTSGNNKETDVDFRKRLNKKIFSWVSKYGFSIQGDKIMLNTDNIAAFMDELDKSFDEWYRKNKPKKN